MQDRALVFGGGGPTGIAWEVGVAAGLASAGVDFNLAQTIVGTSAGSFVGAQLALGFPAETLSEFHLAFARERAKSPPSAAAIPATDVLEQFKASLPRGAEPSASELRELGKIALQAPTMSEEAFVATFNGMFGPTQTWPERYSCCSVDVRSGVFKRWTHADGVPLERAVAASCSVPGAYPPITLKDSLWMDGGARSWTNADCVAGHRRVVVFAVIIPRSRELNWPVLERELRTLELAQANVELITPDARVSPLFGNNVMDTSRSSALIEAGIAQGKREAARISVMWS